MVQSCNGWKREKMDVVRHSMDDFQIGLKNDTLRMNVYQLKSCIRQFKSGIRQLDVQYFCIGRSLWKNLGK